MPTSQSRRRETIPRDFPMAPYFDRFLAQYRRRGMSHLYVPKGRTLTVDSLPTLKRFCFLLVGLADSEAKWNRDSQSHVLSQLVQEGLLDPYSDRQTVADANALVRVLATVLKYLGLVRSDGPRGDSSLVLTAAGELFAWSESNNSAIDLLSRQITKYQLPNSFVSRDVAAGFKGVLPHLLLLQVLDRSGGVLSSDEYRLFVSLASSHDDVGPITDFIRSYRELSSENQRRLSLLAKSSHPQRFMRISRSSTYELSFFGLPTYLDRSEDATSIRISNVKRASALLSELSLENLVIPEFKSEREWTQYLGDPNQQPDWYGWLMRELNAAPSEAVAASVVLENEPRIDSLPPTEKLNVQRRQREKQIEDYYEVNLEDIEPGIGLRLYSNSGRPGRQFPTDVGPIDLLCKDRADYFVVIEIKVGAADDSAIGQIMRYMGWVEKNVRGATGRVRAVLLASSFPDKVHYARSAMSTQSGSADVAVNRLKFVQHGFALREV